MEHHMTISFRSLGSYSPLEKRSGLTSLRYIVDDRLAIMTITNSDDYMLEIGLSKSSSSSSEYNRSVILSDGDKNAYVEKRHLTSGLYGFFKYIKTSPIFDTLLKVSEHSEFMSFLYYVVSRYREEEFIADLSCMDESDIYIANAILISNILDRANKTIAITVPAKQ